jgi:hypothetical protein
MANTSAFLDDLFDPVSRCLTPEVAGRIAGLRASPRVQQKLDELAEKSSEGMLTDAERSEYETYVRAINFIGLLQAKARSVMNAASS